MKALLSTEVYGGLQRFFGSALAGTVRVVTAGLGGRSVDDRDRAPTYPHLTFHCLNQRGGEVGVAEDELLRVLRPVHSEPSVHLRQFMLKFVLVQLATFFFAKFFGEFLTGLVLKDELSDL